jgi:hypothetical protein
MQDLDYKAHLNMKKRSTARIKTETIVRESDGGGSAALRGGYIPEGCQCDDYFSASKSKGADRKHKVNQGAGRKLFRSRCAWITVWSVRLDRPHSCQKGRGRLGCTGR